MAKTYAWNFRLVNSDEDGTAALVLNHASSDSIGVLKLKKGKLEFWCRGLPVIVTKDFGELFAAIDKVDAQI